MATPLVPWLIAGAAGTSYSLLGEDSQRNMRVILKEERKRVLSFQRSSGHEHSMSCSLLSRLIVVSHSLLFILPCPIPSMPLASTVHTRKHAVYRSLQSPDVPL